MTVFARAWKHHAGLVVGLSALAMVMEGGGRFLVGASVADTALDAAYVQGQIVTAGISALIYVVLGSRIILGSRPVWSRLASVLPVVMLVSLVANAVMWIFQPLGLVTSVLLGLAPACALERDPVAALVEGFRLGFRRFWWLLGWILLLGLAGMLLVVAAVAFLGLVPGLDRPGLFADIGGFGLLQPTSILGMLVLYRQLEPRPAPPVDAAVFD